MQMEFGGLTAGRFDRAHDGFIAERLAKSPSGEDRLMEMIGERENMLKALKRVESNAGAPGVDRMKTTQLRGYIRRHWEKIKAALLEGRHKPLPVRRKEIPKEGGGIRLLGIPTVHGYCTWVQSGFPIGHHHPSVSPAPWPAIHGT
jgi:retron-type reverse transcriptase